MPVKCQSDTTNMTPNLAASRLHEIVLCETSVGLVNRDTGLADATWWRDKDFSERQGSFQIKQTQLYYRYKYTAVLSVDPEMGDDTSSPRELYLCHI